MKRKNVLAVRYSVREKKRDEIVYMKIHIHTMTWCTCRLSEYKQGQAQAMKNIQYFDFHI